MSDPTLLPALRQWAENISPGSVWNRGGLAGLWHLDLGYGRSMISDSIIGFRPVELADLVRDAEEAPGLRAEIEGLKAGRERLRVEVGEMVKDAEEAPRLRARVTELEVALERVEALAAECVADALAARSDACSADVVYGAGAVADMIRAAIRGEGTDA